MALVEVIRKWFYQVSLYWNHNAHSAIMRSLVACTCVIWAMCEAPADAIRAALWIVDVTCQDRGGGGGSMALCC